MTLGFYFLVVLAFLLVVGLNLVPYVVSVKYWNRYINRKYPKKEGMFNEKNFDWKWWGGLIICLLIFFLITVPIILITNGTIVL